MLSGALALDAIGAATLALVHSPVSAAPVLVVYGLGMGGTWPAWGALFAVVVHDENLRPRVFARSFQLLNLGLGTGAVIAGIIVRVSHPSSFELIYLIDGATYLVTVCALIALPKSAFALPPHLREAEPTHPRGGYREVLADKRFLRYLVAISLLTFAGYGALNAGFVGYATVVVHVRPSVIAWAFAVNTALIVGLQPLALRLVGRMRRSSALSLCAIFFGASWVVLGIAGLFPRGELGAGLVVAMFAVFSLGEVLFSPVNGPIVSMMARRGLQGRYNATSSSVWTVANLLSPVLAGTMLGARLGDAYLALLIASCAVSIIAFRWMRGILSPEVDNAVRTGVTLGEQTQIEAF